MHCFNPRVRFVGIVAVIVIGLCGDALVSAQGASDSVTTNSAAGKLRQDALALLEAGDDDGAFQLVRKAMRIAPQDPQVVFLMAMVLGQRHRFPEAAKMLDELAEKVPSTRLPVLGQTAEWMVKFGRWSEAEKRYREILDALPDSMMVHRNLAHLLIRQGRRSDGGSHLRPMCRHGDINEAELRSLLLIIHPFSADADKEGFDPIGVLGRARNDIGQDNWDAARRRLESSPLQSPEQVALLGRIYAHLRDVESLGAWVAAEAESENDHSDHWFARGSYHASQGEHERAINCFCETVLRDQTDGRAYFLMGRSLSKLNATVESGQALKRAELIEQTQLLGEEMAESVDRDLQKISTLIDLLERLHRPFEALAWRAMRVVYGQSTAAISEAEAKQELDDILRDRLERVETAESEPTEPFVLCGIDPNRFDVGEVNSAESDAQP